MMRLGFQNKKKQSINEAITRKQLFNWCDFPQMYYKIVSSMMLLLYDIIQFMH